MATRIAVVTILALLAAGLALAANNWWEEIHCSGSQLHTTGAKPPEEPTLTGTQCHGQPGDDGPCSGTSPAGDYAVSCSSVLLPNSSSTFCLASITCHSPTGDYTETCGGSGYNAFAGLTKEIDGDPRGFIYCKKGSTEEHKFCGTPA